MKRYALWILVASVAISALLGCVALLSSHFGETQGKVLLSTLVVAQASLLAMACGASMTRPASATLAKLGVVLAVVTAPLLLIAIWGQAEGEAFWKMTVTIEVASVAVAHASLLLGATLRADRRWVLGATLLANVVLVALILGLLWEAVPRDGDVWRGLGILAILACAGTILVWVFHRMDRGAGAAAGPAAAGVAPRVRYCVSCGADRIEVSPTGVRCYRCGAHVRVELDPTPGAA